MLMQPLPTVKKAYSLLYEEEKQRGLVEHKVTEQVHAMNVKRPGYTSQRQDFSRNWMPGSSTMQGSKKRLHCSYCDGITHTVERCFYLIGFPVGHALHGRNVQPRNRAQKVAANQTGIESSHTNIKPVQISDQPLQFTPEEFSQIKAFFQTEKSTVSANYTGNSTPFCSSFTTHNSKFIQWIIDNEATNHIATSVVDKTILPMFSQVTLPNGSHAKITSAGSAHITKNLHVHDVLCAPSFHVNLLSVSQLTSALNCFVHFFPTFCILQDLATKRMIGLGKQSKGLYYLMPQSESHSTTPISYQVSFPSGVVWHNRLGHPSKLPSQFLSKLIPSFVYAQHSCEVCPLAKQTRLSFPISSIQSAKFFDHIHCDIWGPQKIETHSGAHYLLTIVDDYSRFTWIFLMKFKSETQGLLKSFITFVHTQFNCQVKIIRSDNGLEFISLKPFFSTHGILL